MKPKEFQPKLDETLTDASTIFCQGKELGYKCTCLCILKVLWILNKCEIGTLMNQARKSNFKTHVEKLNPTSRTDLSNKTLHSILY